MLEIFRKAILINFIKFTGKQLYMSLFFNKVLDLKSQKKRLMDYRWATASAKYPLLVTLTSECYP